MKPCRKQNQPPRRPAQPAEVSGTVHRYAHPIRTSRPAQLSERPAVRASPGASPTELHRYVHPIRTARPSGQPTVGDLLGEVLEALTRQSEQLAELLRRLDGYNSDT